MSRTSPSSDFSLIKATKGKNGIIYWDDGHSVYGSTIEAAIAAGMKHYVDVQDEDGENFMITGKAPISGAEAKKLLKAWERQCEDEAEEEGE